MRDSKGDTDVQSGLLDSEGEGQGGMIWENGIETCILSCKKYTNIQIRLILFFAAKDGEAVNSQ